MRCQFGAKEHAEVNAHEQVGHPLLICAFHLFHNPHAIVENVPEPSDLSPIGHPSYRMYSLSGDT